MLTYVLSMKKNIPGAVRLPVFLVFLAVFAAAQIPVLSAQTTQVETSQAASSNQNTPAGALSISAAAEIGFLKALYHDIQIGRDGYRLDYVKEGGQEILLPFYRFEVEGVFGDVHEIALLYQPLTLQTFTRVDHEGEGGVKIDDVTFAHDTPLDLQYGFDFYRGTYRYRFLDNGTWQMAAGIGLQLRNASIIFDGYREQENGSNGSEYEKARVVTQDLGPVPVISLAARREWPRGAFLETTLDGFYAPVRYLNLRDVDVIGWLYDGAIRAGVRATDSGEVYLSLRFLGGGADGTGGDRSNWTQSREEPRYTWNNLNLAVLSLGVRQR